MTLRRREWLKTLAGASVGAFGLPLANRTHAQTTRPDKRVQPPLALKDYQPRSMLHVPETHVPRSRFPNIDFHTQPIRNPAEYDVLSAFIEACQAELERVGVGKNS